MSMEMIVRGELFWLNSSTFAALNSTFFRVSIRFCARCSNSLTPGVPVEQLLRGLPQPVICSLWDLLPSQRSRFLTRRIRSTNFQPQVEAVDR